MIFGLFSFERFSRVSCSFICRGFVYRKTEKLSKDSELFSRLSSNYNLLWNILTSQFHYIFIIFHGPSERKSEQVSATNSFYVWQTFEAKELRRESFSAILQHSTLSIIMIVPSLLWENIKYIAQNYSHKSFSFAEFFYPVCTHEWNSCKFTFINHFFCSLSSERKSTEHFTGS